MLTDLQLQEIKNTIPNIEIDSFDNYHTSSGLVMDYDNDEYHYIFGKYHIILDIYKWEFYNDLYCYNGITEANKTESHLKVSIVNLAINDIEYDFTEQQENEIINSIKEITFKN